MISLVTSTASSSIQLSSLHSSCEFEKPLDHTVYFIYTCVQSIRSRHFLSGHVRQVLGDESMYWQTKGGYCITSVVEL